MNYHTNFLPENFFLRLQFIDSVAGNFNVSRHHRAILIEELCWHYGTWILEDGMKEAIAWLIAEKEKSWKETN